MRRSVPRRSLISGPFEATHAGSGVAAPVTVWVDSAGSRPLASAKLALSIGVVLADVFAIAGTAVVTGTLYHKAFYADPAVLEYLLQAGLLIALLVAIPSLIRDEYRLANYLIFKGRGLFPVWNIAFMSAIALGFLTKTSAVYSRGSIVLFYAAGLAALILSRYLMSALVRSASRRGSVSFRRVFLIGCESELLAFNERYKPWTLGFEIAGTAVLNKEFSRGIGNGAGKRFDAALDQAVGAARRQKLDDVFILVPWAKHEIIDRCVDAFLTVPAAIHLGPERVLERFEDVRISRVGPLSSLDLVRRPLTYTEQIEKRVMDFTLALIGLIIALPLLVLAAIAIKLDSPGPVLFRQNRYGFNQEPFSIFKFRTMTVTEDGAAEFKQAARGDVRITRAGAFLRRTNIDELPQLLNVLTGSMSLVGPRPHAMAHDRAFEGRIALYARRHNVKPGITGWAQVNGFRGDTSTDDKMRARIEHDLYYIDNWSLMLDLRILFMTVFSRKAYRNAF